ncbi:hypothetical protein TNCV_4295821 [Trichonephila clavipes]|nr:hypothetical protein TNCV_4295821 [Trichonephila clavipes]
MHASSRNTTIAHAAISIDLTLRLLYDVKILSTQNFGYCIFIGLTYMGIEKPTGYNFAERYSNELHLPKYVNSKHTG